MSVWKVWYQPDDRFARRYFSGMLTISPGRARFEVKKETFDINTVRAIDRKMVGLNTWVHVAYDEGGEVRDAYFLDRRMLGWSGILGANSKLMAELEEALRP